MTPTRHLAILETFLAIEIEDTTGHRSAEAKDVAKHPTMHRIASHKQRIIQPKMSIVTKLRIPCTTVT